MSTEKEKPTSYEEAMEELEKILMALQENSLKVSELEAAIARSKELIEFCRGRLRNTEDKLEDLLP